MLIPKLFKGVQGDTLTALLPGEPGEEPRWHSCIGQRLWAKFPNDARRSRSRPAEPEETSGGETDDENTRAMSVDESEDELPELPIPVRTVHLSNFLDPIQWLLICAGPTESHNYQQQYSHRR